MEIRAKIEFYCVFVDRGLVKDPVTRREEGATRTRMAPQIMTLFTGSFEIPFSPHSIPMKVSWLSFQIVRRLVVASLPPPLDCLVSRLSSIIIIVFSG